jgi:hypothetical protein
MKLGKILDTYLGKPTNEALHNLPSLVRELGYYFDCRCAFFEKYSNSYSYIVGYTIDEDKRSVTLYTGFLDSFSAHFREFYGYIKYSELISFSKNLEHDLIKLSQHNRKLKIKLYDGYINYLKCV